MCNSSSLGFAFLSSLASAAALVVCVIFGELAVAGVVRKTNALIHNPDYLRNDVREMNIFVGDMALSLICLIAGIISLICFIFSLMLYNGITRRQPGQIKAYLVFGVCLTGLVATAAFCHMRAFGGKISRYVLMGCGSYFGTLVVILVTYRRILAVRAATRARCV